MSKALFHRRIRQAQRIKSELALAGYRLRDIDRLYGLNRCAAGRALSEPNEPAERAIANALGKEPSALWPERYDSLSGHRLSPQPRSNYDRPPNIRQRRNQPANSTVANLTAANSNEAA